MELNKQMEMFEDGGLKDEGGMIDEVSGNDVPSGSTREEVRDDIPAQLSEGEFVFPADVVRFIGLEKLMTIRQKAKMGLQKMEDMGQMGNSEEATIPDDMPFDINDLDMQEDVDNESEMEYNRGGVVKAAVGTYVAPNVPVPYNPMNTTNQITGNPTQMQQPTAFTNNAYASNPQNMYSPQGSQEVYAPGNYKDLLGASATGAPETESRIFKHPDGRTRTIPYSVATGEPLYPIDRLLEDGFVLQGKDAVPTPEPEKPTEKVTSAKVKPVDAGDDGGGGSITSATDPAGDPLSYQSIFSMDALDKNLANMGKMQFSSIFNTYSNVASGVKGKANINALSTGAITASYTNMKNQLGLTGTNIGTIKNNAVRGILNNSIEAAKVAVNDVSVDDEGNAISQKDVINNINALAKAYGLDAFDKSKLGRNFNLDVQLGKKLAEILVEREKDIKDKETGDAFDRGFTDETSLAMESLGMAQQQGIQDAIESGKGSLSPTVGTGVTTGPGTGSTTSPTGGSGGMDASFGGGNNNDGDDTASSGETSQSGDTGFGGGYGATYKGSFITRKQPSKKKPKKMKRGGLASR